MAWRSRRPVACHVRYSRCEPCQNVFELLDSGPRVGVEAISIQRCEIQVHAVLVLLSNIVVVQFPS